MRKDLVLGLSIGGGLLALVVVYLSFISPHYHARGPVADAGNLSSPDMANTTPTTAPSDSVKPAAAAPALANAAHPAAPAEDENSYFFHALYHTPTLAAVRPGSDGVAPTTLPAPTFGHAVAPGASPSQITHEPTVSSGGSPSSGTTSGAAAATPANPAMHTHVVKQGETPTSIAAMYYGNANDYPYILRANPNLDPTHMKIGMVINLPDVSTIHQTSTNQTVPTGPTTQHVQGAIDPKTQYVVEAEDSLYKISIKIYGNATMVDAIYAANKDVIGSDKAKLKIHQVLKLPKAPAAAPTTQQ